MIRFAGSFFILALIVFTTKAGAEELDPRLEPERDDANSISRVYRDMVVVQRKAKDKSNHVLLGSYGSFDFSDGPTTMYGLNLSLGYAFNDHWELYLNAVPVFVATERDIVGQVSNLTLQDGSKAKFIYSQPQFQYGLELLWAPAYGKDSWGPHSIVRSDTFDKFSAAVVHYDLGDGSRFGLTFGKTLFLSRLFNLRFDAGASYVQNIVNSQTNGFVAGIIEVGSIWYL
jgi:hypothetical protein